MTRALRLTMLMSAVAMLGACGGGGNDSYSPPPAPPPPDVLAAVPDSAKQSVDGLTTYLKALAQNASDTREPIVLDAGISLPTNDTAEPAPI